MKIVALDTYTVNPGDLSWDKIKQLGELTVYDYSEEHQIYERAKDADIILANKISITERGLSGLNNLKYIAVTATGYNNIDLEACKKRNISVSNVRGYGSYAVAQHTIALLLQITNKVSEHHQAVKENEWSKQTQFCFWNSPLTELYGKKMGIIGWGNIGQTTAKIAHALGMEIIYFNRSSKPSDFAKQISLEEIYKMSDIVSLHAILSDENREMINRDTLSKMKKTAILLNTARGGFINESDLKYALENKIISAAGLDTLTIEPPMQDHPLFSVPNCIITPHNAWAPVETRARMMDIIYNNIHSFLQGNGENLLI